MQGEIEREEGVGEREGEEGVGEREGEGRGQKGRERGREKEKERVGREREKEREREREREKEKEREMVRSCQLCFAYYDLLLAAFRVLSSSWDKELKLCDLETGQLCVSIRISKQQQPERRSILYCGAIFTDWRTTVTAYPRKILIE